MQLQLITPEKIYFEGDVQSAQIPGALGEFGVLPGHAPFISTLKTGIVTLQQGTETHKILVEGGLAEVTQDHTIILAEKAEDVSSLSEADIAAKLA